MVTLVFNDATMGDGEDDSRTPIPKPFIGRKGDEDS